MATKTCQPDSARNSGSAQRLGSATYAGLPAATFGSSGGSLGPGGIKTFTGATYTSTVTLFRFNTDIGGQMPTSATLQFCVFSAAAVDTDGFSWVGEYCNWGGGTPVAADWALDLTAGSIFTAIPISTLTPLVGGDLLTIPLIDLSGINPSGFTAIRLLVTGANPTGVNNVGNYCRWPNQGANRPGPVLTLGYTEGVGSQVPVHLGGRGGM